MTVRNLVQYCNEGGIIRAGASLLRRISLCSWGSAEGTYSEGNDGEGGGRGDDGDGGR